MKTILIVVGKTTDTRMQELEEEYIKRINHYMPFEMEVIPKLKNTSTLSQDQQKEQEMLLIKKRLQAGDTLV